MTISVLNKIFVFLSCPDSFDIAELSIASSALASFAFLNTDVVSGNSSRLRLFLVCKP
ncbi:hypothetical protein VAE122_3720002 [Vibrio aestuarianus]|nr:hypothetical protein VAE122_3720002 [Vibrio aestuarianus]